MRTVRRFARRTRSERRLLIRSFVLLQAVAIGLRLLPLLSLERALHRLGRARARRSGGLAPDIIVWAVTAVSGYVPRATCLVRALALQTLLEEHGWPSRLCVGIGHSADGRLGGHAWIEAPDGRVINGDLRRPYIPLLLFDGVKSE
jgi:hypothetical protein